MAAIKPCFSPHVCTVGSKWREMIVGRSHIGTYWFGPTYLYAELVALDFKSGKATIQYWLGGDIKGGLVERQISELPAIAGDIDTSYRGSFSSREFKKLQSYDDFESVTAASDDESVTGVCQVCGRACSERAKTCGASCRKRLSRMKH
jgi:hypothetical protein